ncbi:MAG: beta-lactamase family protein [Planctomycetales bacterium]|nr:beta-lactamase family protein [Planctomycetales bacterium]
MKRRNLLLGGAGWVMFCNRISAAISIGKFDQAVEILKAATNAGQVRAASIFVREGKSSISEVFGDAKSEAAAFLLGSISKPISTAALLKLHQDGMIDLDSTARTYLPEFKGDQRDKVTIRNLLTHVSGLPDQLPNNTQLRASHASLTEFVRHAVQVPLSFSPGTKYQYSSMAILLACEIAARLTRRSIPDMVEHDVIKALNMNDSSLGISGLEPVNIVRAQTEFGAPESGAGDPAAASWDWNSDYWRSLGAPWGGAHASARDVATFLDDFANPSGRLLDKVHAAEAVRNHNPKELESRGLGFDVGASVHWPGCSAQTFGHTGSTGTIAWCDPQRDITCVVLTSLPGNAFPHDQHPRHQASDIISN